MAVRQRQIAGFERTDFGEEVTTGHVNDSTQPPRMAELSVRR
jgi:hypothetical protein